MEEYVGYEIQGYTYGFSWFAISTASLSNSLTWVLLSPLVYRLSQRVSFKGIGNTLRTILLSLSMSFSQSLIALSVYALVFFLKDGLWLNYLESDSLATLGAGTIASMVQLAFIMAGFMFFDYYRKFIEKQRELNNAQLYALKMKLHPHFLFNTLHAISSMVDYNQEGAQKMLTRLGSLFRTILENEDQQTVSLEEELKYIQDYLEIEKVRFEDRLQVQFDVSKDTLSARVPSLILQPLVENSIKHGVSRMKEKGFIQIKSERISGRDGQDRVALSISDNGKGYGNSRQKSFGIGIKNVNDRLFRLYSSDFAFNIGAGSERGTVAKIEIPFLQ